MTFVSTTYEASFTHGADEGVSPVARTVTDLDEDMIAEAMRIVGTRTKAKAKAKIVETTGPRDADGSLIRDRDRDRGHASSCCCQMPTDANAFGRALEVQRRALDEGFHRALSLPALLVAATAAQHRRTVLH